MSSEISDILSGFSSAIDLGSETGSRHGSIKLRGVHGGQGRRRIPSQFLDSVSSHASLTDQGFTSSLNPWDDIVAPLDLEQEIESQLEAVASEDESIKYLAEFPFDDIQLVDQEREYRTLHPAVPKDEVDLPCHMKCCIRSFTQDYAVVKRNYSMYGAGKTGVEKPADWEKELPKQVYEGDEQESTPDELTPENIPSNARSRGSWASSVIDLKTSQADAVIDSILQFVPQDEVDDSNTKLRAQGRYPKLFSLFNPSPYQDGTENMAPIAGTFEDNEFPIEQLTLPPPPTEHFGHRLLVKCLSLELEMEVEPIYATIALYDTKLKKKISENFHFDLNSESVRKMTKSEGSHSSISSLARTGIFSVTYPSHDIFIVIKLEKVLQQGDVTECAEPYMKDATEKMQDKAKQNAKWFCERLGRYRMPFAWTAIHLMNIVNSAKNLRPMEETTSNAQNADEIARNASSSSLDLQYKNNTFARRCSLSEAELNMLSSFKPVTLTVSSFFKQESERLKDEDLFKFLMDLKRPSNILKRLKCIPGKMKIDVSPCPSNFPYCITPDLHKVKPYPDQRGRPAREVKEFPSHDVKIPNVTYHNLLYIYPQTINLTNRPGHSRNITVKVQLLESEDPASALLAIYGKSNAPEFLSEAYTAVTYHNKSPDFYEEVKVQLPAKLTSRHHLLFSFFHISCQKKQDITPIETPVGYTWVPLLQNGRLNVGDMSLPVAAEKLPSHYSLHTTEFQLAGVKWIDGRRPVFNVSIHTVSSIHMLDRPLEKFFNLLDLLEQHTINGVINMKLPDGSVVNDLEESLRKSMILLAKDGSMKALVKSLYVILSKLVSMLIHPPVIGGQAVNMGQYCFEAIAFIAFRLHQDRDFHTDSHQRNTHLATFSCHLFSIALHDSNVNNNIDNAVGVQKGSHFATMTRSDKRTRPSVSKATFQISSSNPDLSAVISPDEAFATDEDMTVNSSDRSFIRHSATRSSLMEQAVRHSSDSTGVRSVSYKIFHEEVVLLFVVSSGNVKEMALSTSWFLFELISKSMLQHLQQTGLISAPRPQRFPSQYLDDLTRLVKLISMEVANRHNRDYDFAERLNCNLGFFFNDLISIMDRGFVFQLLQIYCQQLNDKMSSLLTTSPSALLTLRTAVLRIVCSHEHYVTLNLPFAKPLPSSPTPSVSSTTSFVSVVLASVPSQYNLNDRFMRQHYLTGLLISDLRLCFDLADQGQPSMDKVILYSLTTIRNLMASHDSDSRINKNPEIKKTVSSLYLPLLSLTIRALPFAHTFSELEKSSTLPVTEDGMINSQLASAIAGPVQNANMANGQSFEMGVESTRNLLICFLWLLKNTECSMLKAWWIAAPPSQMIFMLDLLYITTSCFEFGSKPEASLQRNEQIRTSLNRGHRAKDNKSRLQDAILGESSARREMLMRRRGEKSATIGGAGAKEVLRWRKDKTEWKQVKHGERLRQLAEDSATARNMSAEVSMIVLDTLELIIETATEMGEVGNSISQIISCSLRVLLHIFSKRQSVSVLEHSFAVQRSIVAKFPELLFEEETEQCADLSLRLLEKCTSNIAEIRRQASASLYLLMRHNFSIGNNFARVKMQVTMSMSSLVGVSHDFDEEFLRRSLKTILSYAEIDSELEGTSFPEQVRDLVFNLHMILSDTVKMKEHQEDPEMLIDLMYRIAKGYQTSPDLRLTWLQNMARQHSERKHQAEAGMCLLHCAGLVAEYLSMIEHSDHLPIGCVVLQDISINILEESAVSDDIVSPNTDAVCTEKYFSTAGLTAILEQAVQTFSIAGLHEVVDMIYKVLVPIYHHNRDYKKLANIHGKLQECFTKISSQSSFGGWEVGKRMFGTYFRVGFYGPKFGDLNGEEFIYKEPAITKLPEISHRLEAFYKQCFGEEYVEMIKDSNTIDLDSLDPNKAFIQITYVEPYFYDYENESKTSYFDRNYNIDKFVYATPFTKDGKSHGEMKEQFKRKTYLQVSHTFPYVKTRISVIKRWEKVLSPLESACEDVKKKTGDLLKAVRLEPADVRMLQVNLQGAVLTAVNQGPMEVANTFLAEVPDNSKQWIPYNDLRLSFKRFIYACSLALKKNKTLISADQKEYQREMERNYNRMCERLKPMINNRRVVTQIQSFRHDI
ncbi:dedicator of cytokinesis protein 7-like isoform X2 [Clavelina lepadiformis]|uniref:dedicator of cytokinesis protein 7-like isoform X2 n=1 Tax=Clavelina lepadiformis TaxID=159417 RepID=UPI0040430738